MHDAAQRKKNAIPPQTAKPKLTEAAQKWPPTKSHSKKYRIFIPEGFSKNAAPIKPYGFAFTCIFRKRRCVKALIQQGPNGTGPKVHETMKAQISKNGQKTCGKTTGEGNPYVLPL